MTSIKRRAFLRTTGAALAPMAALRPWNALGNEPRKAPWKRAFMLGGLEQREPQGDISALERRGLRRRRADQPQ